MTILAAVFVTVVVRSCGHHAPVTPQTIAEHHVSPIARVVATPPPRWTPADVARLRASLSDAFAPAIGGTDGYSLAVIGADGRLLFDDGGDRAVTPASVQKLVVADTAMNLLGPHYRFHTIIAAKNAIGGDGTLDGNMWIVGTGDPSLRSDDLRSGIASLARSGLKHLGGSVVVDPTALHGPEINPHWDADDSNEDYQTATSAVSLDGDTVEFRVYGTQPGSPARVAIVPASKAVHISGTITTSSAADSVIIAGMETPNTFALSGYIPAGAEEKYWLPVHDIPHYVGAAAQQLLLDHGVTSGSNPTTGTTPLDAIVLWDHRSATLPELERHMLYVSDNHYAEQLLRTVGGDASGDADDGDGIAAEERFLRSRAIPTTGMHLVDGSGLARANRIAAITLARILSDAELRDQGGELYPLLPQGGKQGTLKDYDFTTALGRVRAKTGHLTGDASLAGYVNTEHHGRVAFAFLINDSPGDPDAAYVRAVDRLAAF